MHNTKHKTLQHNNENNTNITGQQKQSQLIGNNKPLRTIITTIRQINKTMKNNNNINNTKQHKTINNNTNDNEAITNYQPIFKTIHTTKTVHATTKDNKRKQQTIQNISCNDKAMATNKNKNNTQQ